MHAGRVAYTDFPKLRCCAKRPTPLFSQRNLKSSAPCAHLLGASKCFHKSGFASGSGRVAYTDSPKLRCCAKRPTPLFSQRNLKSSAPCAHLLGASKCQYKGGFAHGTGRVAYLAYVSGLGRARNALRLVLSRAVRASCNPATAMISRGNAHRTALCKSFPYRFEQGLRPRSSCVPPCRRW